MLYKRKPDGTPGFWPNNITDFQFIKIVTDDVIELVELSIEPQTLELEVGSSSPLAVTKTPVNAIGTVLWESNDTNVATVSEAGLVTAVGAGTAIITAYVGTVKASIEVTVVA